MQSQRRDPHRGDHIVRQIIIFPFQVLFTKTNSLFYDIFGFVFQITVVAAMSSYKNLTYIVFRN